MLSLLVLGAFNTLSGLLHSPLTLPLPAPTTPSHLSFHHRPSHIHRLPRLMGLAWARHSTSRVPMQTRRRHRMVLHHHLCQPLRALNQNRTVHHSRAALEEGRRVRTKNMPILQTCSQIATMARTHLGMLVCCGTAKHKLVELLRRRPGSARTIRLLSSSSSTHKIQSSPSFLSSMDVWSERAFVT